MIRKDKDSARIILEDGREYRCDVLTDSMGDKSIDITRLRAETGYITYDPGFVNVIDLLYQRREGNPAVPWL